MRLVFTLVLTVVAIAVVAYAHWQLARQVTASPGDGWGMACWRWLPLPLDGPLPASTWARKKAAGRRPF